MPTVKKKRKRLTLAQQQKQRQLAIQRLEGTLKNIDYVTHGRQLRGSLQKRNERKASVPRTMPSTYFRNGVWY